MKTVTKLLLTGLGILALPLSSAQAQSPYGYGYNAPNSGYSQNYAPGYPSSYGYRAPNAYYPSQPYGYGYGYQQPYAYAPYGYKRNNNMLKRGPFSGNSDFAEELWPGRGSIYDDVLPANGPWNRNWGRAPWNRDYADMYGKDGGPEEWFNFTDPKEGAAVAWEDMLYTPNALGTMPGGWKAPSISVPNPVDVGDEFKNAARDMPDEMQNFSEGFTYGDGYDDGPYNGGYNRGYNPGYNSGGYAPPPPPNRDGINIGSGNRNRY